MDIKKKLWHLPLCMFFIFAPTTTAYGFDSPEDAVLIPIFIGVLHIPAGFGGWGASYTPCQLPVCESGEYITCCGNDLITNGTRLVSAQCRNPKKTLTSSSALTCGSENACKSDEAWACITDSGTNIRFTGTESHTDIVGGFASYAVSCIVVGATLLVDYGLFLSCCVTPRLKRRYQGK